MIDSVLARILCDKCGIFPLKNQEAMHRMLDSFVRHKSMNAEVAVEYLHQRWEEYCAAAPDLRWTYGGAFGFFMSGLADKSDAWPWKEAPRQIKPVEVYHDEEIDKARKAWISENRPDLMKERIM